MTGNVSARPAPQQQPAPNPSGGDPFAAVWAFLRHPGPLLAVALLAGLVIVAGLLLPQMPGQLQSDPGIAARWLAAAREPYGPLGGLFAGLGLFAVIESGLLRLLLGLLGLLSLVHWGDQLAEYLRLRRLARLIRQPVESPGTPVTIPGGQPVFRSRVGLEQPQRQAEADIFERLDRGYLGQPGVEISDVEVAYDATAYDEAAHHPALDESERESRRLIVGNRLFAAARLLFLAGLVLALAALWLGLTFGWGITSDVLAPGDVAQIPSRSLSLSYRVAGPVAGAPGDVAPRLLVQLGDQQREMRLGRGSNYTRLGGVGVWLRPQEPGLYVASEDGSPVLALPGQDQQVARMGFGFPSDGSEAAVLLPDIGAALRIVRLDEPSTRFLVEVFGGQETEAIERFEVADDESVPLLSLTGSAGEPIALQFRLLPTIQAQVRHLPGDWLLVPAGLLILLGALGFVRRPFFVLVQLGPWPEDRAVLVVQSDQAEPLPVAVSGEGAEEE